MRKLAGLLMIVLGVLQGGWIAYNLFVERLPEFQEPILPVGMTTLASGLIAMGVKWMRDPTLDQGSKIEDNIKNKM
jgi:hypothetical protein